MSMEFNKWAAAILLGGLIAMLTGFVAEKLVEPHELEHAVYQVAPPLGQAPAGGEQPAAAAGAEPIAPLLAAADAEAGQKQFKACASCHTIEKGGANKVGPNLWGVVGGKPAHAAGFGYSDAITKLGGAWDYESLNKFLANPKEYAPGTKMTFSGIKDAKDRANLIAWMRTQGDSPPPLPQ